MKIVTWNCNGAFRKKRDEILKYDPDLFVIQECEDPAQSQNKDYVSWSAGYTVYWVGENKHKGLAIFSKKEHELKRLRWWSHGYQLFLPCLFNQSTIVLGVWTKQVGPPSQNYVVQLWHYLGKHMAKLSQSDAVILGDFNSNSIWDTKKPIGSHGQVVAKLNRRGFDSCYHRMMRERHGEETVPTFYLYKNREKPYHLDYIFLSKRLAERQTHFEVGRPSEWLAYSDHVPLVCEIGPVSKTGPI
ncbi:MAG: endonuclease/exonuclease/phosphatase family protein [Chloroflexota bacterium]